MRKILFILFLTGSFHLQAQQAKEGMIRYNVVSESISPKTNKPIIVDAENTVFFKNGKMLSEMPNKLTTMKILIDEKEMLILTEDKVGHKYFSKIPKTELNKGDDKKTKTNIQDPKITYSKEKKKIIGFECSKALITFTTATGVENLFTIWYTEKIQSFPISNFRGIPNPLMLPGLKGMPLEIEMLMGNKKGKMTVKEISLKPVPDAVFTLSTEGYTELKPKTPLLPLHN